MSARARFLSFMNNILVIHISRKTSGPDCSPRRRTQNGTAVLIFSLIFSSPRIVVIIEETLATFRRVAILFPPETDRDLHRLTFTIRERGREKKVSHEVLSRDRSPFGETALHFLHQRIVSEFST